MGFCLCVWPLGVSCLAVSLALVPGCCLSELPLMVTGPVPLHLQALCRRQVPRLDPASWAPLYLGRELGHLATTLLGWLGMPSEDQPLLQIDEIKNNFFLIAKAINAHRRTLSCTHTHTP